MASMETENPGGSARPELGLSDGSTNTDTDGGNDSKQQEEKKSKRRKWRFVPKFGCLKIDFEVPTLDRKNDDQSVDIVSAISARDNPTFSPSHLIIMINGIVGSQKDWSYAAKQFVKKYPEDVIVHCSRCNHSSLTFEGVDVMGRRLVQEVISVIERNPCIKKISFVAHSLGGLVSRYAFALLYETNYLKLKISSTENEQQGEQGFNGSKKTSTAEKYKGKLAGLEPINFVTFATPHLGSMVHNQLPMLCGLEKLEKCARHSSWLLGRTGRHLCLTDNDNGKPPLLLQMSSDFEDLPFISALQCFKRRAVYANVQFDKVVGWCTSSIRHLNDLPKRNQLSRHERFKQIVYLQPAESPNPRNVYSQEYILDGWKHFNPEEMMEAMLSGLTKLSWERADVKFSGIKPRFCAHSTIVVQRHCLQSSGANVVQHLVENFQL